MFIRCATGSESVSESSFHVTKQDDLVVVTTPGEIDVSNAALFREAMLSAGSSGVPVVVVDMRGTEFCDSTGLSVLVRALRQADESGGQVRLVVGGSALQRILAVSGVGGMFPVFASLDQALQPA
jgi:anti-sigma B factor antagonist